MTAHFIIIEGGDGSGKSTLARGLTATLQAEGLPVILTREPGGSPKAEEIRKLILQREVGDNFAADAEMLLFYAARLQHLHDTVVPALKRGEVVICDRFEVSTYAYQIHARDGNRTLFDFLHQQVVDVLYPLGVPCSYMHCEVDVSVSRQRIAAAGRIMPDVFDAREEEFHLRVHDGYSVARKVLHPLFTHTSIDANQTPEQVLVATRRQLGF